MNTQEPRDQQSAADKIASSQQPAEDVPTQPFSREDSQPDPSVLISADSNLHSAETEPISPSAGMTSFSSRGALNDFQILEELGSGTFGVVYRALDLRLDREVAIKLIKDDQIGNRSRIQNFRAEARAAAQLRHPNIVPVHQAGDIGDGQTFIVYGFIQGRTLRALLREMKKIDRHEAVSLLTSICDGLGYAHSVDIVHRDVKPENILIDEETGEPLLADFGCATRSTLKQSVDGSELNNVFIGTPPYFSPEQAAGRSHEADARSDVWALGIILDELITGKRTFRSSEKSSSRMTSLLREICQTDPTPLRDRAPVDRDLNAIWNKCLQRDPDNRYATAAELSADLKRWQLKQPVAARPIGLAERTMRWAQRNPLIATSLVTVFLTVLIAFLVSTALYLGQVEARRDATQGAWDNFLLEDPPALRNSIDWLSEQEDMPRELVNRMWDARDSEHAFEKTWRIALGLCAVDPNPSPSALDYFVNEFFSARQPPQEINAVLEIFANRACVTRQQLRQQAKLILRSEESDATAQLRALCLEWKTSGSDGVSKLAAQVAASLTELAATEDERFEEWLPILTPLHDDIKRSLQEMQAAATSSHQRDLIVDLLDAIEDQPAALIARIADADSSLDVLANQLNRSLGGKKIAFDEFLRLAVPQGAQPEPRVLARLWLAYLLVEDVKDAKPYILRPSTAMDPTAQGWFIQEVGNNEIKRSKLERLVEEWQNAQDQRLVHAILAMGNCEGPVSNDLSDRLTTLANDTADSAVHAACRWALHNLGVQGPRFAVYQYEHRNWRYLPSIDESSQQMYVRIDKPLEPVHIGTSSELLASIGADGRADPSADDNELLHYRQLSFPFEIAAHEVTSGEFQAFAVDRLEQLGTCPRLSQALHQLDPDPNKPAHQVTWHDAVEYCVWLSARYGLESCYGPIDAIQAAYEDFVFVACDRSKNGFRLPTNGEWEFACRAGSRTLWSFGNTPELASQYAVHSRPRGVLEVVGWRQPNLFGLFDMLGNAREWTDEISQPYTAGVTIAERPQRSAISKRISVDVRGGGASDRPRDTRSGRRFVVDVFQSGFRVVRTLKTEQP